MGRYLSKSPFSAASRHAALSDSACSTRAESIVLPSSNTALPLRASKSIVLNRFFILFVADFNDLRGSVELVLVLISDAKIIHNVVYMQHFAQKKCTMLTLFSKDGQKRRCDTHCHTLLYNICTFCTNMCKMCKTLCIAKKRCHPPYAVVAVGSLDSVSQRSVTLGGVVVKSVTAYESKPSTHDCQHHVVMREHLNECHL